MLDPTRFALNAATVGFRKRTGQSVDWDSFHNAIQNQTDAINVRREMQETIVSELHVMGGQRFGIEGNAKTNELARQQRQMNGYPLRSFLATGGPVILPPKHGEGLMATPMNLGRSQYSTYNAVQGQSYVSHFTEPLNAPLENNSILLGRAGIQAYSESASDPYKAMNFMNNMHRSLSDIRSNEKKHLQLRGFHRQEMNQNTVGRLQRGAELLAEEQARVYQKRQKTDSGAQNPPRQPPPPPPRASSYPSYIPQVPSAPSMAGEETFPGDSELEYNPEREQQIDDAMAMIGRKRNANSLRDEIRQKAYEFKSRAANLAEQEKRDQIATRYVLESRGEVVLREIQANAERNNTTLSNEVTQYELDNTPARDMTEIRDRKRQEVHDAHVKETVAAEMEQKLGGMSIEELQAHADLSLVDLAELDRLRTESAYNTVQILVAQQELEDAMGGEAVVSAVIADRARRDFENIGETPNGINQTPVRNSAPSSAHLARTAERDPFGREERVQNLTQRITDYIHSPEFSPQTKKGGNVKRTVITKSSTMSSAKEEPYSIRRLEAEVNKDPTNEFNISKLNAARHAYENIKRGEAEEAKGGKTKSGRSKSTKAK